MKKIVLFTTILLAGSSFYGQKTQMTNAGIELKKFNYIPFMLVTKIASGDYAEDKKNVIYAKEEMDKALKLNAETPMTKPKDLAKLYYYTGVANLSYALFSQVDESIQKDIEDNKETFEENTTKAFKKSIAANSYYEEDIKNLMNMMRATSLNGGVQLFQNKDYENAFLAFASAAEAMDVIGMQDTMAYYNAGLAAENNNDYDNAIKYYGKAADLGYGGDAGVYQRLVYVTNMKNDGKPSEESFKIIQKAKEKYPNDLMLTLEEFNYYSSIGDHDKAQGALQAAAEKDPKNPLLYYNIGTTFSEQSTKEHEKGNHEKASEFVDEAAKAFKKSVELNPEYFDAYYNLGALYYNEFSEVNALNNEIKDMALYNKETEKAKKLLTEAIPYLIKANELDPKDIYTLKMLKTCYAQNGDDENYQVISEKIKALEAK